MSHPRRRCSAQIGSGQGEWRRPAEKTGFEDERGRVAGLGRERRNRSIVTRYRAGTRTEDETPAASEKLQLAVSVDLEGGDLPVLGTRSGESQQMRARETLARIETRQPNEAGYGILELKRGAVPAEGGRSDDEHARGVDPIDQQGPPLCRETPHPPQRNQRECRKRDANRNQSDTTHNRSLVLASDRRFCLPAGDYDGVAPMPLKKPGLK